MNDFLAHEAAYRGNMNVVEHRSSCRIVIMGVGALGSFLADLLARQGYNQITVVDRDKVERANFGTQNYGKSDIGRAKAIQCAQGIMRRIGVKVTPVVKNINASNVRPVIKDADLVIDVFDNPSSREVIKAICASEGVPCVHSGMASLGYFEVVWNDDYQIPKAVDTDDTNTPCDYPLASNLVLLCVGALAEAVNRFVDKHEQTRIEFWLNKIQMDTV